MTAIKDDQPDQPAEVSLVIRPTAFAIPLAMKPARRCSGDSPGLRQARRQAQAVADYLAEHPAAASELLFAIG